jgi:hypothetical protein
VKVLEVSFLTIMNVDIWSPVKKIETSPNLSYRRNLTQGFGGTGFGNDSKKKGDTNVIQFSNCRNCSYI